MLPVYKLAYDLTLKAGACNALKESWAERYFEVLVVAKGTDHPETLAHMDREAFLTDSL